jgi:hypothetical protein
MEKCCDQCVDIDKALNDFQEWIKPRLACIPPWGLRDFDQDPRFTGKTPSAIDIWRKEHQKTCTVCGEGNLDRAIEADAFPNK